MNSSQTAPKAQVRMLGRSAVRLPVDRGTSKLSRQKIKPILYPIFESASDIITDPYWKAIFSGMARGKMPKKFTILNNDVLQYSLRKTRKTIPLSNEIPKLISDVIQFLQENGHIYSPQDYQYGLNIRKNHNDPYTNITWTKITNKTMRLNLILKYLRQLQNKFNLTEKEFDNNWRIFRNEILNNTLENKKIIMENGVIAEIDSLSFDKHRRIFNFDRKKISVLKSNRVSKYFNYTESWDEFCAMKNTLEIPVDDEETENYQSKTYLTVTRKDTETES